MNLQLQLVFIFSSVITLIYIIRKIRKHKLNIDDSIIWIIWSIFLLVISLFPQLCYSVSKTLGFQSTSNFILTLFTFFLYIILFFQNIQISLLKEKNKELTQKISLYAYKKDSK